MSIGDLTVPSIASSGIIVKLWVVGLTEFTAIVVDFSPVKESVLSRRLKYLKPDWSELKTLEWSKFANDSLNCSMNSIASFSTLSSSLIACLVTNFVTDLDEIRFLDLNF